MKIYIFKSIEKFKKDALSKIIYDFIKYLFITYGILLILKFIPIIKEVLQQKINISLWLLLCVIISTIIIVFVLYSFKYSSAYNKLKEQNQIDELTGTKNYKALEESLDDIFAGRIDKDNFPISLILFDIDDFKDFNDKHSYDTADKILQKLGDLFIRDNRISDQVFRYFLRGDEFLIIATKTNLSNGKNAADRKRKLISENNFIVNDKIFKFTVSCGVTEVSATNSKSEVISKLNTALLNAKRSPGKNKTETVF